jgi:DNA-binding NtrC family response regulator
MVLDALARSKDGKLSLEPFHRILTGKSENPEPPQKDEQISGLQLLQQKLDDIWGHFPTLQEADDLLIDAAIGLSHGNQENAATMLGLKRPTLYARLRIRKNRI